MTFINFLLDLLKVLVLKRDSERKVNVIAFRVSSVAHEVYELRKILVLRKIYILIKEMVQIVNEVMGFPILFILLVLVSSLTWNMFQLANIIVGKSERQIFRKSLIFQRLKYVKF